MNDLPRQRTGEYGEPFGAPRGGRLAAPADLKVVAEKAVDRTGDMVADRVDVTVVDDEGSTDTDNAVEDTPIKDVAPAVEVVKTASPTQIQPGESVAYTFTVFNRSTIEPLKVLTLTDDKFGDPAGVAACDLAARPWLARGEISTGFSTSASDKNHSVNLQMQETKDKP